MLHIQVRCFFIVFYFGPCSPSPASSDTSTPKLQYSCKEALASPQFRPPSLQMKAVLRQGSTFAELSRKINLCLYSELEHFSNSPIHSQNAQGPDVMGRTKDTKVMCLGLPWPSFLVNMLLNIGQDKYTCHIYLNFVKSLANKKLFRHFRKKL